MKEPTIAQCEAEIVSLRQTNANYKATLISLGKRIAIVKMWHLKAEIEGAPRSDLAELLYLPDADLNKFIKQHPEYAINGASHAAKT